MASSLFSNQHSSSSVSQSVPQNLLAMISQIKSMMQGQNPAQVAQSMMQSNPQFAQFVNANRGKTPQQVAQEHGINLSMLGI